MTDPEIEAERDRLEQIVYATFDQFIIALRAKEKAITEWVDFESEHRTGDE